jgi:cytochrome c-type biogenesis protein CcmH
MIAFAIAATLLTLAVLAAVLLPLLRGGGVAPTRAAFDQAVYRDQLAELDRDLARGVIGPEEAAAARLEIQRRILAQEGAQEAPARAGRTPALAAALAVLLAGGALGFYLSAGQPGLPGMPLASRPTDPEELQLREALAMLEARVAAEPRNGGAWLLLARTRAALGQWSAAAEAYRRAFALIPATAENRGAALETEVLAAGGTVSPAIVEGFQAVLAEEPDNPVARFYLAVAQAQAGRHADAINGFQEIAAELPEGNPIRSEAARRIADSARAAGLPIPPLPPPATPPDDAQRAAMIRGMVDGLAARLEKEPNDADGWARLGRAYVVLGEREKAVDAYARAGALRPADIDLALAEAQAMVDGLPPEAPFPPRAGELLRRVLAADPRQPSALWHLGVQAAKSGHMAEAAALWERLVAVLPPDSPDVPLVRRAIEAVQRK